MPEGGGIVGSGGARYLRRRRGAEKKISYLVGEASETSAMREAARTVKNALREAGCENSDTSNFKKGKTSVLAGKRVGSSPLSELGSDKRTRRWNTLHATVKRVCDYVCWGVRAHEGACFIKKNTAIRRSPRCTPRTPGRLHCKRTAEEERLRSRNHQSRRGAITATTERRNSRDESNPSPKPMVPSGSKGRWRGGSLRGGLRWRKNRYLRSLGRPGPTRSREEV